MADQSQSEAERRRQATIVMDGWNITLKHTEALEQARQRLSVLTTQLAGLQADLLQSNPLPPWKSFEASIGRAQQAMIDLSLHVAKNKALFDEMAVFPTAEFPGRTQEGLLGQLLRKKLEPSVEDIVAQGLESGQAAQPLASAAEQDKFCDFAEDVVVQAVNEREWAADYTLEEHEMGIENVVTGLQRKLHDPYRNEGEDVESEQNSEQSSDAEPEDEMELVDIHRKPSGVGVEIDVRKDTEGKVAPLQERPQMPLAEQLKFLTTGALPRG